MSVWAPQFGNDYEPGSGERAFVSVWAPQFGNDHEPGSGERAFVSVWAPHFGAYCGTSLMRSFGHLRW